MKFDKFKVGKTYTLMTNDNNVRLIAKDDSDKTLWFTFANSKNGVAQYEVMYDAEAGEYMDSGANKYYITEGIKRGPKKVKGSAKKSAKKRSAKKSNKKTTTTTTTTTTTKKRSTKKRSIKKTSAKKRSAKKRSAKKTPRK